MRSVGLKRIHPGSFNHHLLRAIDLSDNKDLEIPNDAFASLPVLEALNLPGNASYLNHMENWIYSYAPTILQTVAHLSSQLCNFSLNAVNCSLFDEFSGDYVPSIFIEGVKQTNIHCLCKYENYSRRGFCIPGGKAYAAGIKHPPSVWVIMCTVLAVLIGPVLTRWCIAGFSLNEAVLRFSTEKGAQCMQKVLVSDKDQVCVSVTAVGIAWGHITTMILDLWWHRVSTWGWSALLQCASLILLLFAALLLLLLLLFAIGIGM